MNKLRHLAFAIIVLVVNCGFAAPKMDSTIVDDEKILLGIAQQISQSRFKDAIQDSLNQMLVDEFKRVLKKESAFVYSFPQLKEEVSIVTSPNEQVRIFTWYTVGDAGNYHYSGFLLYYNKPEKKILTFELNDCSQTIENYQAQTLNHQNWFGMIYYDIIEKKSDGDVIYTLLGWDGNSLYTTKKIVEPLVFTAKGQPRFGKMAIKFGRKKMKRLVFEYNKRATMMIQYDSNLDMIVMDHLAVFGTQDTDNPMFFGPDMSYDALQFDDGMWIYLSNIDYKRPKQKKR